MYKPVLSPCLLNNPIHANISEQQEFCEQFSKVVDFICDQTTLLFDIYTDALYDTGEVKPPIYAATPSIKHKFQHIIGKILSHTDGTINLLHNNEQWLLCNKVVIDNVTSATQCYINYCLTNDIIVVLFSACKSDKECNYYSDKLYALHDVYDIPAELGLIIKPSDNPVFPKCDSCQFENSKFKSEIKGVNNQEKRAIIKKFAEKVALINGYTYSPNLSDLNSNYFHAERKIYTSDNYYLSIDFESGGFEVFDRKLIHMGQYNFSGKLVKPAKKLTHKIILN